MPQTAMIVGDNWLAIGVAAIAIYAVGFAIYGGLSKIWMKQSGYTEEQLQPHMLEDGRLAHHADPDRRRPCAHPEAYPRRQPDERPHDLGADMALYRDASALYNFVWGPEKPGLLVMDLVHLLLGTLVAGAIISAWP